MKQVFQGSSYWRLYLSDAPRSNSDVVKPQVSIQEPSRWTASVFSLLESLCVARELLTSALHTVLMTMTPAFLAQDALTVGQSWEH